MTFVEPIWTPSPARVERANLTSFVGRVRAEHDARVEDFDALYRWSVEQPARFWSLLWDFAGVIGAKGDAVVRDLEAMPGARWFPQAKLNFAENLLRRRDDHPALVAWNENGPHQTMSYVQLQRSVARFAMALRAAGVERGDRVGAYLPNVPQTVVAMLATTALGAIWSSCSPDFGVKGALDRLGQIDPKVLVAADGYLYAGKRIGVLDRVRELARRIPSVRTTVLVPHLDETAACEAATTITGAVPLDDFLATAPAGVVPFDRLPFDHPVYVMYSSGTTGLPKCMVHGAGGTLLQHLKELVLHTDLTSADRIVYTTTCGWMMWNWLVSSLAVGATVVLYDGSPFPPRESILWDLLEQESVSIFGTGAKILALAEKRGLRPAATHSLAALRTILSTGSPLLPESYDYVYRDIKANVCLSSISGGTDIISCFALGNPIGPVYRGELQTRGLGMKVEVFDEDGRSVVGEKGELVCTMPFPSMPVFFWNDPDGRKYRAAYFEHYPGVWRHGDWVELTEHGGMIFYGRSDATLNPGGVRIGTAEIYRQVQQLDEIVESLVVGQQWEGDVRIVLFVRLAPDIELDDALRERIRRQIRDNASPHHVPRKIVAVPDLPRTVSGKISEIAVRKLVHGEAVENREALANPDALAYFTNLPELREA